MQYDKLSYVSDAPWYIMVMYWFKIFIIKIAFTKHLKENIIIPNNVIMWKVKRHVGDVVYCWYYLYSVGGTMILLLNYYV